MWGRMLTALRRLFGAGKPSQQTEVSWYHGAPSMEQLIENYLASSAATKADVAAQVIASRVISEGESSAVPHHLELAGLEPLMHKGSRLAAFHWAAQTLSQADAAARKRAEEKLHALAAQGFQPAMQLLYGAWTLDTLVADRTQTRALLKVLAGCARQGFVFATLLLGEAILRYPVLCTDEEGRNTVAGWLYAAAMEGSWDALRLLLAMHAARVPGVFELEHRRHALKLLRAAAARKFPDAMVQLARVHLDNVLVVKDTAFAESWLKEAVAAGSLDGKSTYARLLLETAKTTENGPEREELLGKASVLLEEGCAQEHVPSLLAKAIYLQLQEPAGTGRPVPDNDVFQLLHRAAELGDAGMYVEHLLEHLFRLPERADAAATAEQDRLLALLDAPCVRTEPARTVGLALWKLRKSDNTQADVAAALEELKACAAFPGYGPACAVLAEIHALGLYGQKVDLKEAGAWIVRGIGLRNQRCLSLMCLLRLGFFEAGQAGSSRAGSTEAKPAATDPAAQDDAANTALLQTLGDWGERIAAVHQLCSRLHLMKKDAYELLCADAETAHLSEVTASVSQILADWMAEAAQARDYGLLCCLAMELGRAAPGRLNAELACACKKAFARLQPADLMQGMAGEEISLQDLACTILALLQKHNVMTQQSA